MPDGRTNAERLQEQFNLNEAARWVREFSIKNAHLGEQFRVEEEIVTKIHSIVMNKNNELIKPGQYREGELQPLNNHQPPKAHDVPYLMRDFINTINKKWAGWSVTQTGAFSLWRVNWIHPFPNGNGRTSRLFSYLLMIMKARHTPFPGKDGHLVPQMLEDEFRLQYEVGLAHADKGDLAPLESLMVKLLHRQLLSDIA